MIHNIAKLKNFMFKKENPAEEIRCVFDVIKQPKNRRFLIGPNSTFLKSIKVMYTVFQVMYTSFRRVRRCLFLPQIYDVMMTFRCS